MEPVPERLSASDPLDFTLTEPTAILLEPPQKRIYVACDHMPSVPELVKWTTEASAGPPDDVRGVLLSRVGLPQQWEGIEEALARRTTVIVLECKGHVVYPPELRSYIWYNVVPESVTATRIRAESVKLTQRTG